MNIIVSVLVLDDVQENARQRVRESLDCLFPGQLQWAPPWEIPLGPESTVRVDCDIRNSIREAERIFTTEEGRKALNKFDLVLLDNDWHEATDKDLWRGSYEEMRNLTQFGIRLLGRMLPRSGDSDFGPLLAIYTAAPLPDPSMIGRAIQFGAHALIDKSHGNHLLNLFFCAVERRRLCDLAAESMVVAEKAREMIDAGIDTILEVDPDLATRSPRMQECLRDAAHYAALVDLPVLLLGETGTGKNRLARAMHNASRRAQGPFEYLDFGQIPLEIAESTMFGHERGAFTGAEKRRLGIFEIAENGTVLIDEVQNLTPTLQQALLRVLESGEFRRVGGTEVRKAKVRILCAMNQNPADLVEQGKMTDDFRARLEAGGIVRIPSLADRSEDVITLAERFLASFDERHRTGQPPLRLDPSAREALLDHKWSRNIRELRSTVTRSASRMRGRNIVTASDIDFAPFERKLDQAVGWELSTLDRANAKAAAPRRGPQRAVFDLLLQRSPEYVKYADLHAALGIQTVEHTRAANALMTSISRLRSRLISSGLDIELDARQGSYRLKRHYQPA